MKHKYATAIKLLESTIINKNSELKEQSQIIENLFSQKKQFREHIDKLEKLLEGKESLRQFLNFLLKKKFIFSIQRNLKNLKN